MLAPSETMNVSYGTVPCIMGAISATMSRIAVIPFIRSKTTPVAPLCASATAATAEAASAIAPVHCGFICLTALGFLLLIDPASRPSGGSRDLELSGVRLRRNRALAELRTAL
jgi:hypothetical protein